MSDSDFVDIGDELVVRIGGYPIGKAVVDDVRKSYVLVSLQHNRSMKYKLPINIKDYDTVDGVSHDTQTA